jgi:hypothetical protein
MDKTKQKKPEEAPVVSPLANEKTYGERVYSRVFDWGLNYWTNLLASAGFSHWVSNSTNKLSILNDASPRDLQTSLGKRISESPFMEGYKNSELLKQGGLEAADKLSKGLISTEEAGSLLKTAETIAKRNLGKRGFAMAESLTLLVPGFAVMIPSVWLGAKIKPWFVEKLNQRHYGNEAMDDPSLKARHEALRAEESPTLLGTVIARLGTVLAVQGTAKFIGSESNTINTIGKWTKNESLKKFPGINTSAAEFGEKLGSSAPARLQNWFNGKAKKWNFNWSVGQLESGKTGPYNFATQDATKYVVMDTMYTAVSALTIRPFIKLLPKVPFIGRFMSDKPKVAANSPVLDGDKVKVPANRYADAAPDSNTLETTAALDSARGEANTDMPSPKVSNVRDHATLNTMPQQQLA